MDALLVPVGHAWHAIELRTVREVVRAGLMMPVPGGPSWLLGVVNLRGEIVPVVDSAGPLGDERVEQPSHLIVVDTSRGRAAVAASGTPNRVELGDPTGASERRGARGQYTLDERVASLLDLEALVEPRSA
jgi:purine-binding chemotaxis protein CheW